MMNRRWIPVVAVALVALAVFPDVAHACPVCFDPREENRTAFIATAAFMSLFPLGLVGSFTAWLRKRSLDLRGQPEIDAPEE
jgi:hypothetical protein